MSEKVVSALTGLAAALATLLVALGVIGGEAASAGQAVVAAVITLIAALGIHSVRSKK